MTGLRKLGARLKPVWPHLRAVLVLLHVFAVLLLALPAGGRMRDRSAWQTPQYQADIAKWAARIDSWGTEMTPRRFEELLWQVATHYLTVRDAIASPATHYASWTGGARQGWSMFAQPQTHPARVHIEISDGGGSYRPVYIARSDSHNWRADQLDHNRVRKLLGRVARDVRRAPYGQLVRWIAREAAHDFPEARSVRVRLERWRTPSPDDPRAHQRPQTRFTDVRVVQLEPLR